MILVKVIQAIDVGNREGFLCTVNPLDAVSGLNRSVIGHTQVKARLEALQEGLEHLGCLHNDSKFETGHTGLRDFELGTVTDAETVSDHNLGFEQTFGAQVLSELTEWEVGDIAFEEVSEVLVMLVREGVNGFVNATVNGEVGLTVATQSSGINRDGLGYWYLKDTSAH